MSTCALVRPVRIAFLVLAMGLAPTADAAASARPPVISFHLVTDTSLDWRAAHHIDPTGVAYAPDPWLTSDQILVWDTGGGRIVLREKVRDHLRKFGPGPLYSWPDPSLVQGFLILVDGVPCQLGACVSMMSSSIPRVIHFSDWAWNSDDGHVLDISAAPFGTGLMDPRLTAALEACNLRGGGNLSVSVTSFAREFTEAPPAMVMTCGVTLTNHGPDAILVLDPEQIVPGFRGYRAGVRLESCARGGDSAGQEVMTARMDTLFDPKWLVRIPPGGSHSGSVVTKLRWVAGGEYDLRIVYPGVQSAPIEPDDREDDWIWPRIVVATDKVTIDETPDERFHAALGPDQILYVDGRRIDTVDIRFLPDDALELSGTIFAPEDVSTVRRRQLAHVIRRFCHDAAGSSQILVVTEQGHYCRSASLDGESAVRQIESALHDGIVEDGPLSEICLQSLVK